MIFLPPRWEKIYSLKVGSIIRRDVWNNYLGLIGLGLFMGCFTFFLLFPGAGKASGENVNESLSDALGPHGWAMIAFPRAAPRPQLWNAPGTG